MSDVKRVTIRCWQCRRTYTQQHVFRRKPVLLVTCPYCNAQGRVPLSPYHTNIKQIKAGDGDAFTLDQLNLPDVLPSQPPPAGEEE